MTWLIILLVVVLGVAAYKFRAPILAKVLGQSRSRIDRHLK